LSRCAATRCGEHLDVGGYQRALDARAVADGELVEGLERLMPD
jgi:hypothetical protein